VHPPGERNRSCRGAFSPVERFLPPHCADARQLR
jgi:hypothetical protein